MTPDAVEALPADVAPEEAAPLLDSVKDIVVGSEPAAPPPPAEPAAPPPTSDADAQTQIAVVAPPPPLAEETGQAIAAPVLLGIQPPQQPQPNVQVTPQANSTGFVIQFNANLFFENPEQERDRIWDETEDEIFYEELSRGRIKETIVRPNGVQIVTIRDRDGDILRRSRIMPDGREYVLAYFDETEDEGEFVEWRDPGDDLPPLVLNIPARDYILDAGQADEEEVADFFSQPPVEQVRRIYSIEEVKRSARIRDTVRRLEIGGLTFDSGKATISRNQVGALSNVANAMLALLDRNPAETFLIEGHTDAVGSEISNLGLSDLRASTVARILTDFYDIPPENLVTQGYGERYLKVRTEAAERLNRRVTDPAHHAADHALGVELGAADRRKCERAGSNPGPSALCRASRLVARRGTRSARCVPCPDAFRLHRRVDDGCEERPEEREGEDESRMPSAKRHHRADPRDAREDEPGAVVVALRRVGADEAEDQRRDGRQKDRQDEAEDQAGDADPAEQLRIVGWRSGRQRLRRHRPSPGSPWSAARRQRCPAEEKSPAPRRRRPARNRPASRSRAHRTHASRRSKIRSGCRRRRGWCRSLPPRSLRESAPACRALRFAAAI